MFGSDATRPRVPGPHVQRQGGESRSCSTAPPSLSGQRVLRSSCPLARPPQITGVSVLRAGETMEPALRAVCKDVRVGKILIQTNLDSGEPEVTEPESLKNKTILLKTPSERRYKRLFTLLFLFYHMMCVSVVTTLSDCVTMVTLQRLLLSGLASCTTCVCPKTSVKITSS